MTYNPSTLVALGRYWVAQGGVNLGVVGNAAHTKGYHLGKDRIYDGPDGPGVGDADYSVQLPRDKAGLSNAASAIDLGKLNGTLKELRKFSNWLVSECLSDPAIRRDIREIIYSPDGDKVQRYSGPDNKIYTGPGNGDASHLTHTHISFYRDSEDRDKRPLFAPYFDSPEVDVPIPSVYIPGQEATIKPTANIRSAPDLQATILRVVSTPELWTVTCWTKGDVDPDGGSDQWLAQWANNRWEYTAKSNVSAGPAVPTPDCEAAIAEATAPLQATIEEQATIIAAQKTELAVADAFKTAHKAFLAES